MKSGKYIVSLKSTLTIVITCMSISSLQALHAQVPMVNPRLLEDIEKADYTERERRNVDLMIEFFATKNPRTPEITDRYFTEDHLSERDGFDSAVKLSDELYDYAGIPDRYDYLYDMVVQGDRIALIFYVRGTHKGTLFGIPPSGNPIDVFEVVFLRMEDGKIAESWWGGDSLELIMQMGVSTSLSSSQTGTH